MLLLKFVLYLIDVKVDYIVVVKVDNVVVVEFDNFSVEKFDDVVFMVDNVFVEDV